MYAERRRLDNAALRLLDQIVEDRGARYEHARRLSRQGFDVWDVLELEATPVELFPSDDDNGSEYQGDRRVFCRRSLTRRYWAQSIIEVISRAYAIELWGKLVNLEEGREVVSFENTMTALSCFFGKSPKEVSIG